jgi:hypothetical protein
VQRQDHTWLRSQAELDSRRVTANGWARRNWARTGRGSHMATASFLIVPAPPLANAATGLRRFRDKCRHVGEERREADLFCTYLQVLSTVAAHLRPVGAGAGQWRGCPLRARSRSGRGGIGRPGCPPEDNPPDLHDATQCRAASGSVAPARLR